MVACWVHHHRSSLREIENRLSTADFRSKAQVDTDHVRHL